MNTNLSNKEFSPVDLNSKGALIHDSPLENAVNNSAHSDDEFLNELLKENKQLEKKLIAVNTSQENVIIETCPEPEPYPVIPKAIPKERSVLDEEKCEGLEKTFNDLMESIKSIEEDNKKKDEHILELEEKLNNAKKTSEQCISMKEETSILKEFIQQYEEENEALKEAIKEAESNNKGSEEYLYKNI